MSPAGVSESRFCSECGQPRLSTELARFGDRLICPDCKNSYAQKLREGVAPAMAVVYAGFWIRVAAAIIDGIICYVITTILDFATIGTSATRLAANPGDLGAAMSKIGLAWLINSTTNVVFGRQVAFTVHPPLVLGCLGIGIVVTMVSALLPARRAM